MIYGRKPSHHTCNYNKYPKNVNIQWNDFFKAYNKYKMINNDDIDQNENANIDEFENSISDLKSSLVSKCNYYCRQGEESQLIGEYKKAAEFYTKSYKVSAYISQLNKLTSTSTSSTSTDDHDDDVWLNVLHGAGTCRFMNGEYVKAQELFMKVIH